MQNLFTTGDSSSPYPTPSPQVATPRHRRRMTPTLSQRSPRIPSVVSPLYGSEPRDLILVYGGGQIIKSLPSTFAEAKAVAREWINPPRGTNLTFRALREDVSVMAHRLVVGQYLWIKEDDIYQLAQTIRGLRVETVTTYPPGKDEGGYRPPDVSRTTSELITDSQAGSSHAKRLSTIILHKGTAKSPEPGNKQFFAARSLQTLNSASVLTQGESNATQQVTSLLSHIDTSADHIAHSDIFTDNPKFSSRRPPSRGMPWSQRSTLASPTLQLENIYSQMEVPIHAPAGRAGLPDAIDPLSPLLNLDKPLLYALRGNEAAEAGSEIHSYLKRCSNNPTEYARALKLLQDLCSESGELPSCYRLQNVMFDRRNVVGRGGEVSVYEGHFGGQAVVVREVVKPQRFWRSTAGQKIIKLVHREGTTHSQLDHPNIIPILGVYSEDAGTVPMTILPFMKKGSLDDLISNEPVRGRNFARITTGIGRALAYLHSRNPPIYHGDLHTGNVLIDAYYSALLSDFGLSRIRHDITRTHTTIREGGRLRFLAPELSGGASEKFRTSSSSDIFSFSLTILNTWTVEVPFPEHNDWAAAAAMRENQRPSRPATNIGLPSETEQDLWLLLVDMWAHDASSRPSTEDVHSRLEGSLGPFS